MPSVRSAEVETLKISPNTEHFILCEGKDDEAFLTSFLASDTFSQLDVSSTQVAQAYGVPKIRNQVKLLTNADGFSQLRSFLIIRDADTDIQSARDNVKGAFLDAGLPVPQGEYQWESNGKIKTGFLLLPACAAQSQTGSLDDLCWGILSNKYGPVIREEVEQFIHSLENNGKRSYPHRTKALVHTYFSVTEELIAAGIGRAAKAGAFDWKSQKLQPLHDFLASMIA